MTIIKQRSESHPLPGISEGGPFFAFGRPTPAGNCKLQKKRCHGLLPSPFRYLSLPFCGRDWPGRGVRTLESRFA
eukprot:3858726-Pyramimonas_sp.AAC.2